MDQEGMEWAQASLHEHAQVIEDWRANRAGLTIRDVMFYVPRTLGILRNLFPDRSFYVDRNEEYWDFNLMNEIVQGEGYAAHQADMLRHLDPPGPAMPADAMHPLIWSAASGLWAGEHYASAVQRAATFLNADIQDKLTRRDISDVALMQEAFSLSDPAEGKPRLRWPGDDSDLTVKAMRVGILNFAQGAFSAVRNPATHSTGELGRQEALEQLASLSMLARWVDGCEVKRAPTIVPRSRQTGDTGAPRAPRLG